MRKEFSELKTTPSQAGGSGSVGYIKQEETVDDVKILVVSESSPSGDSQTIEDLVRSGVGGEEEDADRSVGVLGLARHQHHPQTSLYSTGGLLRMSSELVESGTASVAVSGGVITLASAAPQTVVVSTGHVGGLATSVINHHSSNPNSNSSQSAHLGISYEHPMTTETSAMFNGNTDDPSGFSILYDYYGNLKNGVNIGDPTSVIKTERTINADIWS